MSKVIIIGGGAAGLLAGIAAATYGADVTIIEKMRQPGKKMLITGKGITRSFHEVLTFYIHHA